MPIYEYQCAVCGHELELIQKMSDEPLTTCPVCNKPTLQKLVSAAGFQLKGTGWYATDFRNSGKKEGQKDNKTESKTEDKKTNKEDSSSNGSNSDSTSTAKVETTAT
jgi:putative FmdB family regulatory protein